MDTSALQVNAQCRWQNVQTYLNGQNLCSKLLVNIIKSPVTRCNFSCNLQSNSTLGRCKIGKPNDIADTLLTYQTFVTNLHLLRVELRCKLQEKLHRVTGPLFWICLLLRDIICLLLRDIIRVHQDFKYTKIYILGVCHFAV